MSDVRLCFIKEQDVDDFYRRGDVFYLNMNNFCCDLALNGKGPSWWWMYLNVLALWVGQRPLHCVSTDTISFNKKENIKSEEGISIFSVVVVHTFSDSDPLLVSYQEPSVLWAPLQQRQPPPGALLSLGPECQESCWHPTWMKRYTSRTCMTVNEDLSHLIYYSTDVVVTPVCCLCAKATLQRDSSSVFIWEVDLRL